MSATIKPIDERSIHLIQSGQVIVDVCSVAKELIENSFDAGASSIDVRFKNQGLDAIEVQDNGSGINPANYPSLALKHHTSKLSSYSDIASLNTFGFRGEALSSLCALSSLTIITCIESEAPKGSKLAFDASGKLASATMTAAAKGTTVIVERLFHSLPVRRRELERNVKREWQKVIALLNQYACIQTNVKFSVTQQPIKGKRTHLFSTEGKLTTRENIINIYGAKISPTLISLDLILELEPSNSGSQKLSTPADRSRSRQVRICGHISRPAYGEGRQAPDRQMFFVNGRPCGLPQFAKTFNEVYKSYNITQSPFIFADIQLDTNMYDVNVSPDKRSILLHDQGKLLDNLRTSLITFFDSHNDQIATSRAPLSHPTSSQKPVAGGEVSLCRNNESIPRPLEGDALTTTKSGNDCQGQPHHTDSAVQEVSGVDRPSTRTTIPTEDTSKNRQESLTKWLSYESDPTDLPPTKSWSEHGNWRFSSSALQHALSSDKSSVLDDDPLHHHHHHQQQQQQLSKHADDALENSRGHQKRKRSSESGFDKDDELLEESSDGDATSECSDQSDGHENTPAAESKSSPVRISEKHSTTLDLTPRERVVEQDNPSVLSSNISDNSSDAHIQASVDTTAQMPHLRGTRASDALHDLNARSNIELGISARKAANQMSDLASGEVSETGPSLRYASPRNAESNSATSVDSAYPLKRQHPTVRMSRVIHTTEHVLADLSQYFSRFSAPRCLSTQNQVEDISDPDAESRLNLIVAKDDFSKMRIVGQFNLGFIIAVRPAHMGSASSGSAQHDELLIIDQHASDEKVNFEKLVKSTTIQSQRLVHPKMLALTALEEEIVLANLAALESNGFVIRAIPTEDAPVGSRCQLLALPLSQGTTFTLQDLEELIALLADKPTGSEHVPRPSKVRDMLASRACRKSIMIGRALNLNQMYALLRDMGELDKPWNCPHGRPTMRYLSRLQAWDATGWRNDSVGAAPSRSWLSYVTDS